MYGKRVTVDVVVAAAPLARFGVLFLFPSVLPAVRTAALTTASLLILDAVTQSPSQYITPRFLTPE